MKKILLIFIFCLTSTLCYGADIDVGAAALVRTTFFSGTLTMISVENPANATGTIDHIEVYTVSAGNIEIATFDNETGTVFSTRGDSGVLSAGGNFDEWDAPGQFSAFNVDTGDYLGHHGNLKTRRNTFGDGMWFTSSDDIPANSVSFTLFNNTTLSCFAEGTVAAPSGFGQVIGIMIR